MAKQSGLIKDWKQRCDVTTNNPSTWSSQIPWIEYARNSLSSTASGVSPFMCSLVYESPKEACSALLCSGDSNQHLADCCCTPAPSYQPGQKIWLSSKDIPLKDSSKKLAPRYLGTFTIENVINPSLAIYL